MKIIHIAGGGDKGGAKTHIFALCKYLSKKNDLTLVSMRKGEFPQDAQAQGINTKIFNRSFTLFDMVSLAFFIKKQKPDIVHCHGAKANLAGVIAKLISPKIPFTTTVHSDYRLDYMHSRWRKYTFGFLNSVALRLFDYHVAVSDNFKKMLIERGFKADKIMPIYNGLDFEENTHVDNKKEYLKELGIDYKGDECILGIAARLTPVKDIPTLLSAFARAYEKNKHLRLLIGGDGDSTESLKEMSRRLSIDEAVVFCGWVRDVGKFFNVCDIDVLCSVSESFPYSILEGIRAGCCVISSDVGGVTNMIDSGENGYVFQPKDIDTFSRYILDLSLDKEKRERFASKLYDRAKSLYSIENMAERQEEIYRAMIALKQKKGKQGVLICGAYGRGNSGDEAILEAIIKSMRSVDSLMPITVMTRKPKHTELLYNVRSVYTFNPLEFIPAMIKAKLFISGGGSLIQNVTSTRSLLFYLLAIRIAKICRCRVLMYGCGIGEVSGKVQRLITKRVINCSVDAITVRDTQSVKELEALGVYKPPVMLSADPAFTLPHADEKAVKEFFKKNELDENGRHICFSLRSWKGFKEFSSYGKAAKYAYEKYKLMPVFLPIEVPKDIEPSKLAAKNLDIPYKIIKNPENIPLIMGFLSKMSVVCAVRLHALVFSASAGVPFIATSYDIKVKSFMENVGKDELCCELKDLSAEWLYNAIDEVMKESTALQYREIPKKLTEDEKINVKCARELLEK